MFIISDNEFKVNQEIYRQNDGLFMGSKLSPILANIYLTNFFDLFKKSHYLPTHWFLYVDDILCIWDKSDEEFQDFMTIALDDESDRICTYKDFIQNLVVEDND